MKNDKEHYADLKERLYGSIQILTRSVDGAISLTSERRGLFNKKAKNAHLQRGLYSALNSANMIMHDFNKLIDLLETYPDTVSDYLLEQKRIKSLEPKVYKAMAKKGVIELDENGEPKEWERGNIHSYWSELKKLMKKEYGVDWDSPADRNQHIRYD